MCHVIAWDSSQGQAETAFLEGFTFFHLLASSAKDHQTPHSWPFNNMAAYEKTIHSYVIFINIHFSFRALLWLIKVGSSTRGGNSHHSKSYFNGVGSLGRSLRGFLQLIFYYGKWMTAYLMKLIVFFHAYSKVILRKIGGRSMREQ